jgi:uncharacterized protein (DUF58 family)
MKRQRRWRDRIYAGPRDIAWMAWRQQGYQSPTVLAVLWGYALVVRHLSLSGRVLLLCSGLVLPYAMTTLLMPIHLLAFAIFALFTVDFMAGWLVRPRVSLERICPERFAVGAAVGVVYRVENVGRRPVWNLRLDSLPLPRGLSFVTPPPILSNLDPGEVRQVHAQLISSARGEFILPALRAVSTFPFNLWWWGCTQTQRRNVIVYPPFQELDQLRMTGGRQYQPGGISLSSKVGDSIEFLGCREFREGDSLRHLHMRSWARTGSPVVKEFGEEYLCRTSLILDTGRRRNPFKRLMQPEDPVFEAAVTMTVAVADWLERQDYVVDFLAVGQTLYRFQTGRSLDCFDRLLDILSCLKPTPPQNFRELSDPVLQEAPRMTSALVVLLGWDAVRQRLVEELLSFGVQVRVLLIAEKADGMAEPPESVEVLTANDIHAGNCLVL